MNSGRVFLREPNYFNSRREATEALRSTTSNICSGIVRASAGVCVHHGMVVFSHRVNVPDGPSGSSIATHTTSREPSSNRCHWAGPRDCCRKQSRETEPRGLPTARSLTLAILRPR